MWVELHFINYCFDKSMVDKQCVCVVIENLIILSHLSSTKCSLSEKLSTDSLKITTQMLESRILFSCVNNNCFVFSGNMFSYINIIFNFIAWLGTWIHFF